MEMFYSSHIPDNDPWVGVSQKSFPVCLVWFDDDNSVKLRDRTLSIACWHLPPDSATFGYATEAVLHTPSIAFRHFPPRKDVVNQCLEFGGTLYLRAAVRRRGQRPPKVWVQIIMTVEAA